MSTDSARHVLLVEDNPADALLARRSLDRCTGSYAVSTVTDGEEALDFLFRRGAYTEAKRPDLVLLDLNLPRISGLDVLQAIKEDPQLRALVVVVLSGSDHPKDINEAYRRHANSFLVKPATMAERLRAMLALEEFWFGVAQRAVPAGS